jgi:nitroreductase
VTAAPDARDAAQRADALLRARRTRKVLDGPRLRADAHGAAARAEFDASLREAIAAAGWAPFHYAREEELPEPWRFTVLDRDALDVVAREFPSLLPGKLPRIVAGAGAMVQVSYCAESDPARRARDPEHHSAAAAAAMALLIACEARGIGSYWCTASPLDAPALRAWCGMHADERWLGAIFVGLPLDEERERSEGFAGKLRVRRTPPAAGWVRWIGSAKGSA